MPNALQTGVSGLIAHQRMLDVVSNNLANINTLGYKTKQTLFADLFYTTTQAGNLSNQIGTGVRIGQITKNFSQGNAEQTGQLFDFAIQGDGFFVFDTGEKTLYGRGGSFGLDSDGFLVDQGTGFRVTRFGTIGEGDGVNPGFQTAGVEGIHIPFGASIPGEATSDVHITGNLNAAARAPTHEQLTSARPLRSGGVAATETTLLSDLDTSTFAYTPGDNIEISGVDFDGSPISFNFAVGPATTVGDLVAAVNGGFSGATAAFTADGNITLTAQDRGETSLDLNFADVAGNVGQTQWIEHSPAVTTPGRAGGQFETVVQVYDVRGGAHPVRLRFEKQALNTWNLTASMSAADGTIVDGFVEGIRFNDNGSLQQVVGTGLGDKTMTFAFDGIFEPQVVRFSFGDDNSYTGITQLATNSSISFEQDGFAPGTLHSVNTTPDGTVYGIASNGRNFPLAQFGVASFRNMQGLRSIGDNYFEATINSGDVHVGTALSGDRGGIISGQLETSNVEVAQEFTRLIVAQRGFSANARVITVSDRVLEELTNIIR